MCSGQANASETSSSNKAALLSWWFSIASDPLNPSRVAAERVRSALAARAFSRANSGSGSSRVVRMVQGLLCVHRCAHSFDGEREEVRELAEAAEW